LLWRLLTANWGFPVESVGIALGIIILYPFTTRSSNWSRLKSGCGNETLRHIILYAAADHHLTGQYISSSIRTYGPDVPIKRLLTKTKNCLFGKIVFYTSKHPTIFHTLTMSHTAHKHNIFCILIISSIR